jgi:hypothetical protein
MRHKQSITKIADLPPSQILARMRISESPFFTFDVMEWWFSDAFL